MADLKKKKHSRAGRNTNAILQMLFIGIIVIFTTLTLPTIAPRYDLTEQKSFSLSSYTEKLLKSPLIEKKNINCICLANQSSPYFNRVKLIFEEYARVSGGKFNPTFIDPTRHISDSYEVIEKYGLRPTEDLIILDAGKKDQVRIIPFSNLLQFEVDQNKQRKLTAYLIEDVVSTSVLALLEEKRRTVYLVADNTKSINLTEDGIGATLQSLYRNQNIDILPLSFSEIQTVPENAAGLVFLTPQYDLEPNEVGLLEEYWQRPKSSILFVFDPTTSPKELRSFIRRHGVTLKADRIFKANPLEVATKTSTVFTKGSELNKELEGQSTIFDGISSTLEIRENAEDLINRRIAAFSAIQTSSQYYSEARHIDKEITFNPSEDNIGPLNIAAAVIKGNEMNDSTAHLSSRFIALSTADFLKPEIIRAEQVDFMKNSINWLVGRPNLIGIGPKPLQKYKLNLVSSEVSFINRLTLIILPLCFLIIGAFVWNLRRS